ncbi:hypothetical protein [Candidatus Poriferisodalis sp.]|uniref:hypothetical protein n=1 Tax=Candidatus Poriferisodalis sp. TaxID=3101277 RepID=UPI003B5B75D4
MLPLAGGYERYFDTLAWILQQCRDDRLVQDELQQRYMAAYSLDPYVALVQIQALQKYGLLEKASDLIAATSPSNHWLETRRADFVIGTMHANLKFVGELIHEVRLPRTRKSLLKTANNRYGFGWQKDSQIAYRLGWLRSAGFAQLQPGNTYQATSAGLEFLERIELYRPTTESAPALGDPPPESVAGTAHDDARQDGEFGANGERGEKPTALNTKLHRSTHDLAAEIGDRLVSLSCDGSKHQEFELVVRDAFAHLGFSAEHMSGPGQTDVLLTGIQPPEARRADAPTLWSYMVAVDAKAATNGKLADLQVTWPALALHREKHAAAFSMLVGPSPRPRLLQFAAGASVAVLSADQLAGLCRDHAEVPLPAADYFWLFADAEGEPRGGAVDLSPIAAARAQAVVRRDLLAQVVEAVSDIAADFGPANQQLVRFSLTTNAALGGDALSAEVAAALDFLGSSWLRALVRADPGTADPHYVPTAPRRAVAARLRWLADAFDEHEEDAGPQPGSGSTH